MPNSVYDRGLMRPADVAKLQRVFDAGCLQHGLLPESAAARELALTVLALHNAGMVDEEMLTEVVCLRRPDALSA